MICNNCGKENLPSATFCEQCGEPFAQNGEAQYQQPATPYYSATPVVEKCAGIGQIVTNLVLALLFSSLPCMVLAVFALFFRSKYDSAIHYKDIAGANSQTSRIKTLMTVSWIVLAISAVIAILAFVFIFVFYFGLVADLFSEAVLSPNTFMMA